MDTLETFRRPLMSGAEQTHNAFEILHYTQSLIQFADNKANTLILINSIALACVTAVRGTAGPWSDLLFWLKVAFLAASVLSIVSCLAVVLVRNGPPESLRRRDLIFFADIVSRETARGYRFDFLRVEPGVFLNDLLECNFRLAGIAAAKYHHYGRAQKLTVVACALWLTVVVISQLTGAL